MGKVNVHYTLREFLIGEATHAASIQRPDGSWVPGANGPYGHVESPVRVTAHRAVLLAWLVENVGGTEARDALARAADFLKDSRNRPHGWTPVQRSAPGLDRCNGLIGPAWTVEGLLEAHRILKDQSLAELALELILMHAFDQRLCVWRRREVDGSDTGIDTTLNHQIWFGAAAAMVNEVTADPTVRARVRRFLDALVDNMGLHRSGLVRHPMERRLFGVAPRVMARVLYELRSGALLREKAVGYHMFNLYGLALIKRSFGDHEVFSSPLLSKAVGVVGSTSWSQAIQKNRFGFPYNAVGWEAPFALSCLAPERVEWARPLVQTQVERCVPTAYGLADREAADISTSAARVYELVRAPGDILKWTVHRPV